MRCFLICLSLLNFSLNTYSQKFRHSANLGTVSATGYHAIPITSELSAYLRADLADIRMVDANGQQVPYFIYKPIEEKKDSFEHIDLEIVSEYNNNFNTILIFENASQREISSMNLNMSRSSTMRFAALSKGRDTSNWTQISDSLLLLDPDDPDEMFNSFEVSFSPASERYLRLVVYNENQQPVNINTAYTFAEVEGSSVGYQPNPDPKISQSDSAGYTLLVIENNNDYHVHRLKLNISSPSFYKRRAKLYRIDRQFFNVFNQNPPYYEFLINSNSRNEYPVPVLETGRFFIVIQNDDEPTLQFSSVSTQQEIRYIVASLENEQEYFLEFDDSTATAPSYNLDQFKDVDRNKLIALDHGEIEKATTSFAQFFQNNGGWIWPLIILIIALIAYFAWQFSLDIKKKK